MASKSSRRHGKRRHAASIPTAACIAVRRRSRHRSRTPACNGPRRNAERYRSQAGNLRRSRTLSPTGRCIPSIERCIPRRDRSWHPSRTAESRNRRLDCRRRSVAASPVGRTAPRNRDLPRRERSNFSVDIRSAWVRAFRRRSLRWGPDLRSRTTKNPGNRNPACNRNEYRTLRHPSYPCHSKRILRQCRNCCCSPRPPSEGKASPIARWGWTAEKPQRSLLCLRVPYRARTN
jgi:hypothetical protein